MTSSTAVEVVPLGPIPCTYVYVAALQRASMEIAKAIKATEDGRNMSGTKAGEAVERARQALEGIYALKAAGIKS